MQRSTLHSMLEELASKGGLLGDDRITTQRRLVVRAVKTYGRCGGCIYTGELCRGRRVMDVTSWCGDGALREIAKEVFYAAQPSFNLINLAFTEGYANRRLVNELPDKLGKWLSDQQGSGVMGERSHFLILRDLGVTDY